ncbi:50S ribosomal protein L18 [Spirochaetia bacterium]|nr:50S ribosomal protein L18 [Spirochaetia bacterium]GHU34929.1 50S ribosomal protein L18 [Spirochaetia bacterium]
MLQKMLEKNRKRLKRKAHIRKTISGTVDRPRMTVTKSNRNLSIQVIDDSQCDSKGRIVGHTVAAASTLEKELRDIKPTVEGAAKLGELMGKRLLENNIKSVVFDRNGYLYHGVVKAIADSVRKSGIVF